LRHVVLAPAIASKYGPKVNQLDVSTALLGVDLEEEINKHPPQGCFLEVQSGTRFKDPGLSNTSRKLVLRFRKCLYGLKHSAHAWYVTFKDFGISIGFMVSCSDGRLFVLHNK
jgi:hypothetical protein